MGGQGDLARATHERELVGVLHHAAARGDRGGALHLAAGAALAMPSEKAKGIVSSIPMRPVPTSRSRAMAATSA